MTRIEAILLVFVLFGYYLIFAGLFKIWGREKEEKK